MRCTECNKFCGAEAGEPEVDSIEVDVDEDAAKSWKLGDPPFLSLTATIIVPKTSECCDSEVATATVSIECEPVDDSAVLAAVAEHLSKDDCSICGKPREDHAAVAGDGFTLDEACPGQQAQAMADPAKLKAFEEIVHSIEIEDDGASYTAAYKDEKTKEKHAERVEAGWHITCCSEELGDGTLRGEIEEWEAY